MFLSFRVSLFLSKLRSVTRGGLVAWCSDEEDLVAIVTRGEELWSLLKTPGVAQSVLTPSPHVTTPQWHRDTNMSMPLQMRALTSLTHSQWHTQDHTSSFLHQHLLMHECKKMTIPWWKRGILMNLVWSLHLIFLNKYLIETSWSNLLGLHKIHRSHTVKYSGSSLIRVISQKYKEIMFLKKTNVHFLSKSRESV